MVVSLSNSFIDNSYANIRTGKVSSLLSAVGLSRSGPVLPSRCRCSVLASDFQQQRCEALWCCDPLDFEREETQC